MKRPFLVSIAILAVVAFTAVGLYAGTKAPDVIEMKAGYDHKKGIVQFTHKKHVAEYKNACGDCHHDDKGKPLNLKEGDDVKSCFACHNKPGELKGKNAKGLSNAEKLAYHANALHENCIDCHKDYNKKKGSKDAPVTCVKCHPKTK